MKNFALRALLALLIVIMLTLTPKVFGAAQTTVNFDTGSKKLFGDAERTAPLSDGSPKDGDGCVVELGYYSGATATAPFAGTWVALTGESGMNAAFDDTSIGDSAANGAGPGTVAFSLTFAIGDGARGNSLPAAGTQLAVRFYNGRTVAGSTAFNAVAAANWRWRDPQEAPANPAVTLSLNDANLEWLGGVESAFVAGESTGTEPAAAPLIGSYQAMISPGEWNPANAGLLTLKVLDARGKFTAVILSGGKRYRFRGMLSPDGQWEGDVTLPGAPNLRAKIAVNGGQLEGSVTFADGAVSQISGSHLASGPHGRIDALKGSYTLLLVPDQNAPAGSPTTPGFASMKISANGVARITGTLPDGTSFSTGAPLLADDRLMINLPSRAGRSGIVGELVFRDQPEVSDADGVWRWRGGSNASADAPLRVIVSKYDASAGPLATGGASPTAGESHLQFTVFGASGTPSVTRALTLAAGTRLLIPDTGDDQMSISVRGSSGIFGGSFSDSAGRTQKFSGAFFQKQQLGAGLFGSGSEISEIELRPAGD